MQEVFSKIINKLNERIEYHEKRRKLLMDAGLHVEADKITDRILELDFAKRAVEQEATEYNDGWIPCSERLPEEYTVLCCDKYGEMIVGHPYFDEVSDTNYSAESDNEMMYNCVAWQPTQPYQPKGE